MKKVRGRPKKAAEEKQWHYMTLALKEKDFQLLRDLSTLMETSAAETIRNIIREKAKAERIEHTSQGKS